MLDMDERPTSLIGSQAKLSNVQQPLRVEYEGIAELRSPQFYTLNQGRCFAEVGAATQISPKNFKVDQIA